jgi:catechol 2,3-dioxygenase-like lactoylglutathione lyase family enzyme
VISGSNFKWAAIVPELTCSNLTSSLDFYTRLIGFAVQYSRPGFHYLALGEAQLMLEQGPGDWQTGELQHAYGRGINFQIEVPSVSRILEALSLASIDLFRPPVESWYRAGAVEHGQREFLVQDPDGYLLRFCEVLGERPLS